MGNKLKYSETVKALKKSNLVCRKTYYRGRPEKLFFSGTYYIYIYIYEGRTEIHEQLFFACEMGAADEGEYGGRWNQLLCYP